MQYREGGPPHEGGYGRGWREPKAQGLWSRLKQIGREPATTRTWIILLSLMILGVLLINSGLLWLLA